MNNIEILYKNEDYIVCLKPAGINSQDGEKPGIPTLLESVAEKIKPLLVHRLDREVAGCMVLALNSKTAALLTKQITEHSFTKEYLAIVEGEVEENGILEDLLFYDRFKNKTYTVKKQRKGVKPAKLEFWRLATCKTESGAVSLVRVKLYTGRTHQIRIQFASRKHPLFGDRKYGSKQATPIALFSYKLGFSYNNAEQMFTAKPENIFPWSLFEAQISEI